MRPSMRYLFPQHDVDDDYVGMLLLLLMKLMFLSLLWLLLSLLLMLTTSAEMTIMLFFQLLKNADNGCCVCMCMWMCACMVVCAYGFVKSGLYVGGNFAEGEWFATMTPSKMF